ncbi:MAG: 4Fe-4S dicluster domain-containing protein [Bacteroidales bacterium]|nr:4Fe-4S dicluster domain-containing protein [Bacteroidales bacterium]
MQKGFVFDINKCVACQACVVACQIENLDLEELVSEEKWAKQIPWRNITIHNEFQHPELPVFNFSMACNHCEDAPCMSNCPALAYTRNQDFGAVIHQAEACIGCRYCTMVCPYDAPKYNPFTGIIEKCTLCVERLADGKKTACASACPTGALDFKPIQISPQNIEGFPETGIKPAIEIKKLHNDSTPKQEYNYSVLKQVDIIRELNLEEKKKNVLLSEWPLLIFSLLIPLLVSAFYASFSKGFALNKLGFIGTLVLAGVLSLGHLGKKLRAWRVILNIRNSWLSREILAYSLFVPAASLWLYYPRQNELGLIATILGLLILVAIDNIYRKAPSKLDNKYHSADVLFFTAFLYVAIFVSNPWMFYAAIALKVYLYITRKLSFKSAGENIRPVFSVLRVLLGFIIPAILFFLLSFNTVNYAVLILVILGELIDRIEFYMEL